MILEPLTRTEDSVVLDIADMIRRDGNRIYGGAGDCAFMGSLCGLTAGFARNGDVMVIKSADLHVDITLSVQPIDDSDGIDRYKNEHTHVSTCYQAGDVTALRTWHKHLSAYRRSMRGTHTTAAA